MLNIKQFKIEYKKLKSVMSAAQSGRLTFGKIVQVYGNQYKSKDDFVRAIKEIMQKYEASTCMFYNIDGTVNERDYNKFYTRFIHASEDEKLLFEMVNDATYEKLLADLNDIRTMISEYDSENNREFREIKKGLTHIKKGIEDRIKMKRELVELGIAEDDGLDGVIHIIPERFVDYLSYLKTRHN